MVVFSSEMVKTTEKRSVLYLALRYQGSSGTLEQRE